MSSKAKVVKEITEGEKRRQLQQGGSGTLWSNQDEMKRYVSKLKLELDEQKSRVKRVHRDKAEEIKRLQENLDNERLKAIDNIAKKLESDKAYELKKLREAVVKQKESELRQALRLKDEEMKALRQEVLDCKNAARVLEQDNKRILSERLRGDTNETERRLRNEVAALRNDKKRLEESLKIKSEADFEKAEIIRQMKHEHDTELQRLTRESKRESLKEFRHLKAVSKEIEMKNHQLAAKDAEMRRLEKERDSLGNELNLQRKKRVPDANLGRSNSFKLQKSKQHSVSHVSESDFESAAEDRIKKLKMRNSELVAIARKLEEKAKKLQEEKNVLEKSSGLNPELGNIKKAFARQRAKDLAEHAKLLMNKDHEIDHLKKNAQRKNCENGFAEIGNAEDLATIVEQSAKERLLLEKQLASQQELLAEEVKDMRAKNLRLSNDNEILKEELSKIQDIATKHQQTVFQMNHVKEENKHLLQENSEKDKRIYKLELEKQTFLAKNNALQKKNNELSHKVDQLEKVEQECTAKKEELQTLKKEHEVLSAENSKLHAQIESLSALKKEVDQLEKENVTLKKKNEKSILKLQEREKEILRLHEVQNEAQKKHNEEVSERDEMILRLQKQRPQTSENNTSETHKQCVLPLWRSTPKIAKFTQTSRPSSPTFSPINSHSFWNSLDGEAAINDSEPESQVQDYLRLPGYGTSSSTSFDLEKAATRIEQLATSDSDEVEIGANQKKTDSPLASFEVTSDSEHEEESENSMSEDTSYSADVSRISDTEEPHRTEEKEIIEVRHDDGHEVAGVFIGIQLTDVSEGDEKLSIFIAKYSYDPMLYSPNENPEAELAFQAGDYLYVYGDIDEDGFYVGELMNGERGLVPSNFVERIAEDEAILKESEERDDEDESEERRHEMFRTSLDHILSDQLDDIRESEEDDLGNSSFSEDDLGEKRHNSKKTEADQNFSDGLDLTDSDVLPPRIPSPSKLSLDRQFTKSALISWRGATLPSEEIKGYNVYVDGMLKSQIKGNKKTNALVEDIYPSETYRLSVRTQSVKGKESPDYEATMVFGPDAKLSPYDLRISNITQISADVHWVPANSCYDHEVLVDGELVEYVKPSVSAYTLNELCPSTEYRVQVRTQIPTQVRLALGKAGTEDNVTSETEFTTLTGGLPEPPVDLRLEQQTSEHITLTWLPVTISQTGHSNGFKVSGYKVYVNGIYCTETDSAVVDSVNITTERLFNLGKRHDFTCMRFVVRTQSVLGESADSNAVEVLSREMTCMANTLLLTGGGNKQVKEEKTNIQDNKDENILCKRDNNADKQVEKNNWLSNNLESCAPSSDEMRSASDVKEQRDSFYLSVDTTDSKVVGSDEKNEVQRDNCISETIHVGSIDHELKPEYDETMSNNRASGTGAELCSDGDAHVRNAVAEEEIGTEDGTCVGPKELSSDARRKPTVVHYEIEDESTTDSCTTETKTETEEETVEIFVNRKVDEKAKKDENHTEQDLAMESTVTSNNDELQNVRNELTSELTTDEQEVATKTEKEQSILDDNDPLERTTQKEAEVKSSKKLTKILLSQELSESETETDYGPPLSVIDEVDEENITETSNNSFPEIPQGKGSSNEESTLPIDEQKSEVSDSSKLTTGSGSRTRTRTLNSEDEGFRTDDDVLDLLDDDDDFVEMTVEKSVKNERLPSTKVVVGNEIKASCPGEDMKDDSNLSASQPLKNGTTEGIPLLSEIAYLADQNQGSDPSDTLPLKLETNGNTSGEESNKDVSESSYPARTSLNSDSSLSISDAPPAPHEAVDTIIKVLSFPENRKAMSGENDINDNLNGESGSELTSGLLSESCRSESEAGENVPELVRYFVALYNYDPMSMSPNADGADEELPFVEGDLIKVFGEKDDDGFFWGECKRKQGFVPSNMISEITIDEAEDLFNEATSNVPLLDALEKFPHEQTNGHRELDVDVISEDIVPKIKCTFDGTDSKDRLAFWNNEQSNDLGPRKMRALFDYNPAQDSPNVDSEVELMFKTGEIIYVFGDMDDDGFYQGEIHGIRGLVPSNFLELIRDSSSDVITNIDSSKHAWSPAEVSGSTAQEQKSAVQTSNGTLTKDQDEQQKKKKGIFSKGKKIFKKAFR